MSATTARQRVLELRRARRASRRRRCRESSSVKFDTARHVQVLLPDPPLHGRYRHRPVRRLTTVLIARGGEPARRPVGVRGHPRVLGGGGARDLQHRPQRPRRDHGDGVRAGRHGVRHDGLPALHEATGASRSPTSRAGSGNSDLMPGPLIKARVGDKLRVHFKNLDTAFNRPHSMHFHGVEYKPSSDGSYLPGLLRPRRRRQARPDVDLQADRGQGLRRRLAVPRPRPGDGEPRSTAACSGCSRSSAGASRRRTASTS